MSASTTPRTRAGAKTKKKHVSAAAVAAAATSTTTAARPRGTKSATARSIDVDDRYDACLAVVARDARRRIDAFGGNGRAIFTTDAEGLYETYLANAPPGQRQHRTCNTCKRFFDNFGGLAVVDERNMLVPLFWGHADIPSAYHDADEALARRVRRADINGVFVSGQALLGVPRTEEWTHFAFRLNADEVFRSRTLSASQRAAELREEHGMLVRGLEEFPLPLVHRAHSHLTNGDLYRSEKCVGVAKMLLDLHTALAAAKSERARENLLWSAVAAAPPGFCHVKSTMIGSLLTDLAAGLPFADVKRAFDSKMDPRFYQRPVAAPSAGVIEQAERLVDKLGIARSLERRYATLNDVAPGIIWRAPEYRARTTTTARVAGGVFAYLRTEPSLPAIDDGAPARVMTWVKFRNSVLLQAHSMQIALPARGGFSAYVTATHDDAPPILQWDDPAARNPVSWYVYTNGSTPSEWNLSAYAPADVTAVVLQPSMWQRPGPGGHVDSERFKHHGESVLFALKGARDTKASSCGLCLFPETLKSDLHGVRSVIEAHSKRGRLTSAEEASVCGLRIQRGDEKINLTLSAVVDGMRRRYLIDRWD